MAGHTVVAKIVEEEELIKVMVDRLLCWRLPDSFSPDAGIAFTKPSELYPHMEQTEHMWPTGTNLLDAEQAEQMVRHMLGLSA